MITQDQNEIIAEILRARNFVRKIQDVKYILVTDEDTDYTSRLPNGEYIIYLTKKRVFNGHFAAVFPAAIHEVAHIRYSDFDLVPELASDNLRIIDELRVNYFITQHYPGITDGIASLYPESQTVSFDLLSKLTRSGYPRDILPSSLTEDEKNYILWVLSAPMAELEPDIIGHFKKAKALLDKDDDLSSLLQELSDLTGSSIVGSNVDSGCMDPKTMQSSKINLGTNEYTVNLNVQLIAAQDKEDFLTGKGNNGAFSIEWTENVIEPEIDDDLLSQFKKIIRARNGERSQKRHGVDKGRLSTQKLHLAPLAMKGATKNIFARRDEGLLSCRYGILLDVSGSMSHCIQPVSSVAATLAAALKHFGKGNVVYGSFADKLIISSIGFSRDAGGGTNGANAIREFQKHADKMIVISDFEFDQEDISVDIPIIGINVYNNTKTDLPFPVLTGDWRENLVAVCKDFVK